MLTLISVIFVFSVLVVIHELGHFIAARLMGVRVEKFSIGMPPTLFSKKIGDTEWCISAIPLGGFVKMSGFVDESMDTNITGADYEYSSKPVWKRMVIISAGVIMNLILAMVIYAVLSFSLGETITPTTIVNVDSNSAIATQVGFKTGDRIVAVNGQAVDNWEDMISIFYGAIDQGVTFTVEREGQTLQLKYAKELLSEKKGEQLGIYPLYAAKVGEVQKDMPAGELGLEKGDIITELDGRPIHNWQEMTDVIRENPGKAISIKWIHNGVEKSATITPAVKNTVSKDGIESSYGMIGIGVFLEKKPVSLIEAITYGIEQPFVIIAFNIKGLWWWISGVKTADETIGGPLMIAKMAGEAAEAGWVTLFSLIAALSSVLAFFNILPIPVLDGGHLFLLLIEAVTRKPLSVQARVRVQQVGMALLLFFIIFVLYVDVNRLLF